MSARRGRPPKVARRGRPRAVTSAPTITADDDAEVNRGGCVSSDSSLEVLSAPPVKRGRGRPSLNPKPSQPPPAQQSSKRLRGEYNFHETRTTAEANANAAGKVPVSVMKKLASCLPESERDGEEVMCGDCGKVLTYWQFRLHNIQWHLNTAPTREEKEDLVMDHKHFARKLNEFKRLTKLSVFACPRAGCTSSYKSTLGLAYHMNTCGRTQEELEAVLIECEICNAKLSLPNMAWHRKTHEEKVDSPSGESLPSSSPRSGLGAGKSSKRKSAMIARSSLKKMSGVASGPGSEEDEWTAADSDQDDEEADEDGDDEGDSGILEGSPAPSKSKVTKHKRRGDKSKPIIDLDSNDYTLLALEFLESLDEKGNKAWDESPRTGEDPFLHLQIPNNPLSAPEPSSSLDEYLPDHRLSVEFKCITVSERASAASHSSASYHRLNWFEGETVEVPSLNSSSFGKSRSSTYASIHHTGGPVLSMAWHPSGKFLAVSVGHSFDEELDSLVSTLRKSCVQIYRRSNSALSLQLVLGVQWGYVTHLQWSTFLPDIIDSYNPSVESCFDDIEIYARIGYLAMCSEDSTVRIFSLGIQDLKLPPNYEYRPEYKIKVYNKNPEIELRVDETVSEDPLGNAVRFDWHEKNKYFAVGYANGFIAVFNLQSESSLLVQKSANGVTIINPFWTFQGHRHGVRGVKFDPTESRYLVTCGQDRQMKTWDLHTRTERENKRTGICLDMTWIRGWIHQAASFENIVAYQSSMHNYVRVFQTGSGLGKPSSAETFNVTSLDFYHGLTAQGTEDGKLNVTYYDWFWRDCDYERNRKKKNLAILSSVEVDKDSYRPFSADHFSVQVKKLKKSVLQSKLYQRLAINDEEGVYSVSLEAKFGNMNIFDELPNENQVEEEPSEENEEEDDVEIDSYDDVGDAETSEEAIATTVADIKEDAATADDGCSDLVLSDAINSAVTKAKDGLIPIYDVKKAEDVPRLNISLVRIRPSTGVPSEGLEPRQVEEYIRFYSYLRINKVTWSPSGDVIAVGYRNGLITLLPGNFDTIFQT